MRGERGEKKKKVTHGAPGFTVELRHCDTEHCTREPFKLLKVTDVRGDFCVFARWKIQISRQLFFEELR